MRDPVVGSVGYATEQGLGHLLRDFHANGVVHSVVVYDHPDGRPTQPWYGPDAMRVQGRGFVRRYGRELTQWLDSIDVLLCFETPHDWEIVPLAKSRGVRTVLMPMYEWCLLHPPHEFDYYLCPSLLDQRYFPQGTFIPVPVDPSRWERRTRVTRFLHNAGGIGSREHKGTRELIKSLRYVGRQSSLVEITIRSQNSKALERIVREELETIEMTMPSGGQSTMRRIFIVNNVRVQFEFGGVDYSDLFRGYDALVQPEKYNGLSLPLQEAYAAGMFVMTTDRFPINSWLPKDGLIPFSSTRQVQVAPGHRVIYECVVEPERIAEEIERWNGYDISSYSDAAREWANHHSWRVLKERYQDFFRSIGAKT